MYCLHLQGQSQWGKNTSVYICKTIHSSQNISQFTHNYVASLTRRHKYSEHTHCHENLQFTTVSNTYININIHTTYNALIKILAVKAKLYVCICIGTIYILLDYNTLQVFTQIIINYMR